MRDLISVIVPVYNSEQYIYDCVASVLRQTYDCWELLLVDDGSGDGSRSVCREFCEKDGRIRLLERVHKGVSAARNAGIEAAEGKYVFFMDSDDVIHPQLLEKLYFLLETENTVIAAESHFRGKEGVFKKPKKWKKEACGTQESVYLNNDKAIDYRFFGSPDGALYAIGGKMIRRESLKNIRFDEKLTHGEDTLFLYLLIADGADVSVLKRAWYYYRASEKGSRSIFSVNMCRSKHTVNCYARDRELESGRESNALRWESIIHNAIMKWYLSGQETQDDDLMEYVKELAGEEMKLKIFSRLSFEKKRDFYLTFSDDSVRTAYYRFLSTCEKWGRKKPLLWVRRKRMQAVKWIKWNLGIKLKWKIKRGIAGLKWLLGVKVKWMIKRGIAGLKWLLGVKVKWMIKRGIAGLKWLIGVKIRWGIKKGIVRIKQMIWKAMGSLKR